MNKRTIVKKIYMNKDEAKAFEDAARKANMKEAAYGRMLLSRKASDNPEIKNQLARLCNEINHIGVNVNQIVKNNNSGLYSAEDKDRLLAYMSVIKNKLQGVISVIDNQQDS